MENNTFHNNEQVLMKTTPEMTSMHIMPVLAKKPSYKKPVFWVMVLGVISVISIGIFFYMTNPRFHKPVEFKRVPMTDEDYRVLNERLEKDGFFRVSQIDEAKLKELQEKFESDPQFMDPALAAEAAKNQPQTQTPVPAKPAKAPAGKK